ncbi:T9SS type A sorting domain-containing protein, partial [bacterium]|nr:T9SS type A sorting domain-containing protein [bacterium]
AITWWENADGSGTSWIEHTVCNDFNGARSVYSEDIDGDGYMDILGAAQDDDDITWWENSDTSPGIYWTEHMVIGVYYSPRSVYSEDVDGDGNMEILGVSHGDISWWEPLEYTSDGFLESSCLYLGNDPGWGSIDWTCNVPTGTSVSFQVRSCDSPDISEMGPWSDTLTAPCSLYGILDEDDSFFQYRAILDTTDSCETPVLEDVTITWDPVGIEEGEATELRLLTVAPNPSSGFSVLRFYLPVSASVKLNVFDLSGRIVQETHEDEYSAGYHDVQLEDLLPGIYFCRMTSGDFSATQRFVVIE